MATVSEVLSPTNITQRINGSNSRMRRGHSSTLSDDELESSLSQQVSERVKSDRIPLTKPEEDHRRRTIIVEKKNGSYGFTLQSYGIHYKKVQEVEMITYVDFVEYDGPAYKAGMREGDVILSINGTDMEKADHKTLVSFIKECDSFMRMVVLFEDCVRKVGLHMRYIQLQNILQAKMSELERICVREHELLQGKWKTHSLPARKKATTSPTEAGSEDASPSYTENKPLQYSRPTLSTEDVNMGRQKYNIIPPPAQFMLAYQVRYLDPNCRYIIRPSTSNSSGEYLVSIGPPTTPHPQFIQRTSSQENNSNLTQLPPQPPPKSPSLSQQNVHVQQNSQSNDIRPRSAAGQENPAGNMKGMRHAHAHFCNPCVRHSNKEKVGDGNDKDNVSLDAYDLASPCCEPHCVPTKRRSRHHKDHHHKHKHRENKERPQRPKSQSHVPPTPPSQHRPHHEKHTHRPRYFDLSSGLASHCSLHSCTSSEYGATGDNSGASYSTSLSTDTLYWEPHSESSAGQQQRHLQQQQQQPGNNSKAGGGGNQRANHHPQFIHRYYPHAAQIQPAPPPGFQAHYVHKPKSWDNLTTKSFGGYGFGYGYLDTVTPKQTAIAKLQPNSAAAVVQQRNSMPRKNSMTRYSAYCEVENYAPPPTQFIQQITTTTTTTITAKSTENLIGAAYSSDTSLGCDCLLETAVNKPTAVVNLPSTSASSSIPPSQPHPQQIQQTPSAGTVTVPQSTGTENRGYYSNLVIARNNVLNSNKGVSTTSEITRL